MGIKISQKEISLDLQNQGFTNTIYSQEGDTDSRQLTISLFDDGEKYIIDGSSNVYLEGVRADNASVHRKVDSFNDNVVKVLFKNEELCVKGVAKYKVVIYGNDGGILSSVPFKVKVYENVYDGNGIIASPTYTELEETLNKVKELETTISNNETVRENNENVRKEKESERVENEENRKEAESLRTFTEEQRVQSEDTRNSNENTRKSNESERVTSESERVLAENTRTENESTRNSNENERILNEDNRTSAEKSREQAESKRVSSETGRITNEESRATAENKRSSAEETRVGNEDRRKESEQLRVTNETSRINAEEARVTEFNDIKSEFETISSKAENMNVEAISSDDSSDDMYQVKVTNKNGESTTSPNLLNKIEIGTVETEMYDQEASASITGKFGEQKLNLRIPVGKPFKIKKSYKSIVEMNENIANDLELGEFCIIDTGSVEDEDTAKLYMRNVSGASFLTDLSGAQGIQGVKGDVGETPNLTIGTVETGAEGSQATATITGTAENPILNLTIPRGMTGTVENISGASIPYSSSEDEKSIKDVVDDKLGKTEQASDSATVNGHTVESNVPANAQFTDTVPIVDAELSEKSTNAVQNKVVAGKFAELETDLGNVTGTVLTATLTTGETTLEITSEAIKTTSMVDLYTDVYGINPTDATVADGKITLTFKDQTRDISVKAVIK